MKQLARIAALLTCLIALPAGAERPMVLELFTSQGCPSCPEADDLLGRLAARGDVLALSLHVDYFDRQGWKDPFASPANTQRQQRYVRQLGQNDIFTPMLIVDGLVMAVGSEEAQVQSALRKAKEHQAEVPVTIQPTGDGSALQVKLGSPAMPVPRTASLYEVHFDNGTVTPVTAGDNEGKMLRNIHNVTGIVPLQLAREYLVPLSSFSEPGIAFLLQDEKGRMIGAAYYKR